MTGGMTTRQERSGTEPTQARSALGLRAFFSGFGVVVAALGAVLAQLSGRPGWAVTFAGVCLVAVVDLVVVKRRMNRTRGTPPR